MTATIKSSKKYIVYSKKIIGIIINKYYVYIFFVSIYSSKNYFCEEIYIK